MEVGATRRDQPASPHHHVLQFVKRTLKAGERPKPCSRRRRTPASASDLLPRIPRIRTSRPPPPKKKREGRRQSPILRSPIGRQDNTPESLELAANSYDDEDGKFSLFIPLWGHILLIPGKQAAEKIRGQDGASAETFQH